MDDTTLAAIIIVVVFLLLIKGVIKTFIRSPLAAVLCLIFIPPVFFLWAFIEIFRGKASG